MSSQDDNAFATTIKTVALGRLGIVKAATRIASLLPVATLDGRSDKEESTRDDALWHLWTSLVRIAQEVDDDALDRLVALVEALKVAECGQDSARADVAGVDLAQLGMVCREELDIATGIAALRFHCFEAKLTATKTLDLSLHGLWMIRRALEDDVPTAPEQLTTMSDAEAIEVIEVTGAAAAWLCFAMDDLHALSQANTDVPDRCGLPGSAVRHQAWRGFDEQRWAYWLERLPLVFEAVRTLTSARPIVAEQASVKLAVHLEEGARKALQP